MYYLEIDNEVVKHECKEVKDITLCFDIAIAHGAQSVVIWLRRKDGDRHVIARYPTPT